MKRALLVLATAVLTTGAVTATAQATIGNPDNFAFKSPAFIVKGVPVTTASALDRIGVLNARNRSGRDLFKVADTAFYMVAGTFIGKAVVVMFEKFTPVMIKNLGVSTRIVAPYFVKESFGLPKAFTGFGVAFTLAGLVKHFAFPDVHAAKATDQYLTPEGINAFLELPAEEQARLMDQEPKIANLVSILSAAVEDSNVAPAQN